MKTLKINSFIMLVSFSFIILFPKNSRAQSGSNNNSKPENNSYTGSIVETPKIDIQAAIISDNLEIVKQHIAAGTDINMKNPMSGSTPLITAATFGKTAVAKALLDAGADKTLKNNHGATPGESVIGPFAEMKPIYEMIQQQLEPLGLKLNFKDLEISRPVIAMMLK